MKKILYLIVLFLMNLSLTKEVGLLIVATGKYIQFAGPLVQSARKYFCKEHKVTYFIFTDGTFKAENDVYVIPQPRLGWPHDTLLRCNIYLNHYHAWEKMDYVFACDADMKFVNFVGSEILSDLVATQHPGFINKRGTYETRKNSTAYIKPHEGRRYYAGGFHGGSKENFFHLISTMVQNIRADLTNNIIAIWHDESHLNRYFIDKPPSIVLSPSYCYPENWKLPYDKKLLALDKAHNELRK